MYLQIEYLTNGFYFKHLKVRQEKLNGQMAIKIIIYRYMFIKHIVAGIIYKGDHGY